MRFHLLTPALLLATALPAQVRVAISGMLTDQASHAPLPYFHVSLRAVADSAVVAGTVSDADGRWVLQQVVPGNYLLNAGGVGYAPLWQPLHVGVLSESLDLGALALRDQATQLGAVEVVARTEQVGARMDKQVYRMDENASQGGGSLLQAMRNLPGVTVDQRSGKLQLRGSDRVAVLVDGQQTALTGFGDQSGLDNIPASAIERIEVINDPSAKQDANGMAGIINIIYRKEVRKGVHGRAALMGGIGSLGSKVADLPGSRPQYLNTPKLGPSLGLNWERDKLRLYVQGDLLTQRVLNRNEHFTRSYDSGDAVRQQYLENREQTMYTLKTGMDLHVSSRDDLSFSGLYNREGHIDHGDVSYYNGDLSERARLWQFHEDEVNTAVGLQTAYTHRGRRAGERLDLGLNYTFHREDEVYDITDDTQAGLDYYNTALIADEHVSDIKLDYARPLRHGRVELGGKFRWRHIPTRITYTASEQSPLDPGAAGGATYDELIPAAYGNYIYERECFDVEAGLRMEYVDLTYHVEPGHNTYTSDGYHYLQPFPNLRLGYKAGAKGRITLNLSRRVDRPDEGDLRIFPKYDDPGILRIGNPGLRPQFTWRGELGARRDIGKGYVYLAAYHRLIQDILTRIVTGAGSGTQLYTLAQNAGAGSNTGLELVLERELTPSLKLNLNGSLYRNVVEAFSTVSAYPEPTPYSAARQELTSGNVKANLRVQAAKPLSVQLTGQWYAADIVPQGSIGERWSVDLGAAWKVPGTRSELTLSATDLLNTMRIRKTVLGDGFQVRSTDYLETRAVRVTWAWGF